MADLNIKKCKGQLKRIGSVVNAKTVLSLGAMLVSCLPGTVIL